VFQSSIVRLRRHLP